jgi:hypothetical protein
LISGSTAKTGLVFLGAGWDIPVADSAQKSTFRKFDKSLRTPVVRLGPSSRNAGALADHQFWTQELKQRFRRFPVDHPQKHFYGLFSLPRKIMMNGHCWPLATWRAAVLAAAESALGLASQAGIFIEQRISSTPTGSDGASPSRT